MTAGNVRFEAWTRRAFGYGLALLVFAIDRGVKALLLGPVALDHRDAIAVLPIFALRFTQNFGVSLGLFTATSAEMRLILIGVTTAIALGVAAWLMVERRRADVVGLALVLGGALGNIYDRVVHGFVIDYADFHIGAWRPFLIFNLADAAITFGVLILLARSLLSSEKPGNSPAKTPTENS
ncbi:signal peptidase II [Novosphingobium sp. Fuku2-ISO-50]|uniref:signal peptidase II n=1 Tax=Novosphingobium sp. Fuku2-ISO-50 TaxID=1739114 RepID=UPI00076D1DCF|nr:signal peptidase II [Novosphingobium sp. Fuku2-ISO-50]KUR71546.1 signal peptidase II [Novosphingobium sp. Fuku2-ISO-50]